MNNSREELEPNIIVDATNGSEFIGPEDSAQKQDGHFTRLVESENALRRAAKEWEKHREQFMSDLNLTRHEMEIEAKELLKQTTQEKEEANRIVNESTRAAAEMKLEVEEMDREKRKSEAEAQNSRMEAIEAMRVAEERAAELQSLKDLFNQKEKELQLAMETIESLNQQVLNANVSTENLEANLNTISTDLENERQIRKEKENTVHETLAQLKSFSDALEEKENQVKELEDKNEQLTSEQDQLRNTQKDLDAEINSIKEENELLRRKLYKYRRLYEAEADKCQNAAIAYRIMTSARQKIRIDN